MYHHRFSCVFSIGIFIIFSHTYFFIQKTNWITFALMDRSHFLKSLNIPVILLSMAASLVMFSASRYIETKRLIAS